jgi:hypothetical protein
VVKRKFLDVSVFESRKMDNNGNIDYKFWFGRSVCERLTAASAMIAVAFKEPNFLVKKVDRTVFSSRKHLHV